MVCSTLFALVVLVLAHSCAAHYNLINPLPYNKVDCNLPDCAGPCPRIWKAGNAKARNSPANPAATWRRGQTVPISWQRNNHEGGFYRRSLVPVKHMNDRSWHKKTAFEWGCWTQGKFQCGTSKNCGTDMKGAAYRNTMKVPEVFPDGDYVFAMVWYGGLHWKRDRGFFSDYWTCAYVRIRGGPTATTFKPVYTAGRSHHSSVPNGKCLTSKFSIGECGGEECPNNPAVLGIPSAFQNGRTPPNVNWNALGGGVLSTADSMASLKVSPTSTEGTALANMQKEQQVDDAMVKQEEDMKKKQGNNGGNNSGNNNNNNSASQQSSGGVEMWRGQVVPQWPTGTWGVRGSALHNAQAAKWHERNNWCKANPKYPNCRNQ